MNLDRKCKTLTVKSKSHKKAKFMNSDRQIDRQEDRETDRKTDRQSDRKTDQQTVKQKMINHDRLSDIDRQKQMS